MTIFVVPIIKHQSYQSRWATYFMQSNNWDITRFAFNHFYIHTILNRETNSKWIIFCSSVFIFHPNKLICLLLFLNEKKNHTKYQTHSVEKQNIDVQPIIYRLTQETVLNPTTIKSNSSHATVTPNINDNDSSATTGIAFVTNTTVATTTAVVAAAAAAAATDAVSIIDININNNKTKWIIISFPNLPTLHDNWPIIYL